MADNLVIVESVTKTKTIKKYLGNDYLVLASYGHVRDLLPKSGAVDPDHKFAMTYELIERNKKHVDAIVAAAKKAQHLYLATDPDREGEAISWHLLEILKTRRALKHLTVHRVVFNEITKHAVTDAMEHPRELSMDLVYAQQARRALDYLVGFNLSPLLWKKIRRGLSAGRVQSPALRMIVEREAEIERFVSQEYWYVMAQAQAKGQAFQAKLIEYQGQKQEKFSINTESQAQAVRQSLLEHAHGHLTVVKVDKKQRKRNPTAPFTTSTLQQEAARKLGFTTKKTMQIAQQLYEGVDVGQGLVGLITYMRTDSVNMAQEAVEEIRQFIVSRFGPENLPEAPRVYKTKAKNAQEAHEAIRPTAVTLEPETCKNHLSLDQFKLYQLIWQRTVACQMMHSLSDVVSIDLEGGKGNVFRATGSTLIKPGFMSVYQEGVDDKSAADEEESDAKLPPLNVGEEVTVHDIVPEQHFTEPPPRYSEASLVKALEEYGIGRPSTYASIISTLQQREYVSLLQKRFYPTDVGRVVNKFLTQHFTQYVDYDFTAKLEDTLDQIAEGEKTWVPVMKSFWLAFKERLEVVGDTVQRKDVTQEPLDEACPSCGKPLSLRLGRSGRFIGCTDYPTCSYTRNVNEDKDAVAEAVLDRACPSCAHPLQYKQGRYGRFIGCSNYPACKHIESLEKPADTGVRCPECHQGTMVKRKSRYGTYFYACSGYPTCKYAVNHEPLAQVCPNCRWPMLMVKTTKRRGTEKVCPQKNCGFSDSMPPPEE